MINIHTGTVRSRRDLPRSSRPGSARFGHSLRWRQCYRHHSTGVFVCVLSISDKTVVVIMVVCHSRTDGLERTPPGPHSNLSMSCGRTTGSLPGVRTVPGDGARPVGRRAGVVASPGTGWTTRTWWGRPAFRAARGSETGGRRAVPRAALHSERRAGWNQRTPRVTHWERGRRGTRGACLVVCPS